MTTNRKETGAEKLEELESYAADCRQIGQGINSKEAIPLRWLGLLSAAPVPLDLGIIASLLMQGREDLTLETLLRFKERGWVRQTEDERWEITGQEALCP